ncbi:MAG TPA: hypothetical protein VMU80_12270, partial [Bryobacteraceae bacterium]|nr:hypothetical protein [Bryobacteraceae bacterium]
AVQATVRDKLAASAKLSKNRRRSARLKFYSNAAEHCLYLKELRNEASHTRGLYNAGEALGVMERVRAFMLFLAEGLNT